MAKQLAMLKACVEQLQEYSTNEWVIGEDGSFTIEEIKQEIQRHEEPKQRFQRNLHSIFMRKRDLHS